jgi:NADH-quinone oxidoreductase subunit F
MERVLTRNIDHGREPLDLRGYEKAGGYAALRKALQEMSPKQVQQTVEAARLRGRGGAGFDAGKKWSFVPLGPDAPRPKYLLCNADEMEPGTFKDRLLMEGDPHSLLEGMLIAAYAIEADVAWIFLRAEYKLAERRLRKAIAEAYAAGYAGRNVLGSDWSVALRLHVSAGRYMCGEETGLINALEGKRATPRNKPPYPQVSGLWGKPTVVNNVETLCNVGPIIARGSQWFLDLAPDSPDGGTKLYGASGRVRRPGLWELPIGVTLREVLEEHAGSMRDGYAFRGCLPGGASTDFLVAEHLDVRLDFDAVAKVGSRLGTGTMIVLDDRTCPVGMIANLEKFFARESCGWCTPCRDGLPWTHKLLEAIDAGRGEPRDLEILEQHTRWMAPGRTFCALAPGAVEPLQSGLKYFRDDFRRHIEQKRCPWRGEAVPAGRAAT